jgi:hypothetical protein
MRIYDANKADQIYAALHKYTPSEAHDPKSAIILSHIDAALGISTILIFYYYDGVKPTEGPMGELLDIDYILSITDYQSYADLVG